MNPDAPPKVIGWYKAYAVFMCLLYLVVAAFSLTLFFVDPGEIDMSEMEARIFGICMFLLSLVLFAVFLLPLILRPRPWLWIYNLVAICIGLTSACILPACVPLLIFWLKPEVKKHFGYK